jgi:hypothetical protein
MGGEKYGYHQRPVVLGWCAPRLASTAHQASNRGRIIGAIANLLADRGYRFIPDARLPEMKQALLPFMVTD